MRNHAKFRADRFTRFRDIANFYFSRWLLPQSWIFNILTFNSPNSQEGRTASLCQISSESLEPRLIYGYF